ncbi:hypothetical protein GALMADRAFT_1264354 [Galerina marginata CBS 339.88]|uniref:Uncharacterized protein n=1 Tax=Galerina marginata (strain CBS 339.88) TaxID=685588 RepID=A0A067TFM2_GALM3|nr:hypothetical protein GALMADRAFT_1264354 [Galerina marginata CBS 339.88]
MARYSGFVHYLFELSCAPLFTFSLITKGRAFETYLAVLDSYATESKVCHAFLLGFSTP